MQASERGAVAFRDRRTVRKNAVEGGCPRASLLFVYQGKKRTGRRRGPACPLEITNDYWSKGRTVRLRSMRGGSKRLYAMRMELFAMNFGTSRPLLFC